MTDLLALPIGRADIVAAKFIVGTGWSGLLAALHYAVGALLISLVFPQAETWMVLIAGAAKYALVSLMVIGLSLPVGWVASVGRGYLLPLGYVLLTIVAAQLLGAVGAGPYFPWAVPGLYSGVAGADAMMLGLCSLLLPFLVGLIGMGATLYWWRHADFT